MEISQVIKHPILTEKTYKLMDKGIYTFAVKQSVNKYWVKDAVEFIFDVKVAQVNIIKVAKKAKKVGRFSGFVSGYKKAIVKLSKGTINFFPEEQSKSLVPEPKKAIVEEKNVEPLKMSDAEKRAAQKIALMEKEKNKKKSTSLTPVIDKDSTKKSESQDKKNTRKLGHND